jgi:glycosyltransferase involved in cell wall biosynthesis
MKYFLQKIIYFVKKNGFATFFYVGFRNLIQIISKIDVDIDSIDPKLENILIVSHEASRTGAPILSLNIASILSKKYNIFIVLLGSGPLTASFEKIKSVSVSTLNQRILHSFFIHKKLSGLTKHFKFKFAIVNSIESRIVLESLSVGTPVLISQNCGQAHIVEKLIANSVCMSNSSEDYSRMILHFKDNPLSRRDRIRLFTEAKKVLGIEVIWRNLSAIYESVA